MKTPVNAPVIIVGAGLAGLSCAVRLLQDDVPFIILEAQDQIGGRVKTENLDGYLLNYGFQVLQTAYTEAQRLLDYNRLDLKPFVPGAMIRINGMFFRIADPRRRPFDLWNTLRAPFRNLSTRSNLRRHLRICYMLSAMRLDW